MMIPQHTQPPCRCCGNDVDECCCPLCPVCQCSSDADCYIPSSDEYHGLVYSLDQLFGQFRHVFGELERTLAHDKAFSDGLVNALKKCLPVVEAHRMSSGGDRDLAIAARAILERSDPK